MVGENAVVGARPEEIEQKDEWGVAVIGDNIKNRRRRVVPPKAMIDKDIPEVAKDARK